MPADENSVLRRAALILDAFEVGDPALPLAELTSRTGLPKSTVHRLAEQLLELGWLERNGAGYRIGLRLFEVGGLADRRHRLVERAGPHLQQLSAATSWSVHLGVLGHGEVVYLAKLPVKGLTLPTRDGGRMPAHCTGLGKALLAWSTDEAVAAVLARELEPLTPATIVNGDVLRAELATVRERGVAFDRDEACAGVSCVAAPIRGSGRAIAAVSLSGTSHRIDLEGFAPVVRRTADAIWQDLFGPRRSDVA